MRIVLRPKVAEVTLKLQYWHNSNQSALHFMAVAVNKNDARSTMVNGERIRMQHIDPPVD